MKTKLFGAFIPVLNLRSKSVRGVLQPLETSRLMSRYENPQVDILFPFEISSFLLVPIQFRVGERRGEDREGVLSSLPLPWTSKAFHWQHRRSKVVDERGQEAY